MNTLTKHECNEIKRKISHQQKTIRQSVFNEDQSISDQSVCLFETEVLEDLIQDLFSPHDGLQRHI